VLFQTLMSVGGIPFQSKLEPYFDLIVAARRKRKTWAQITELIKERGTDISHQKVVIFFKTRKKRHHALSIEPDAHEKPAPSKHPVTQAESPNAEPTARGNWTVLLPQCDPEAERTVTNGQLRRGLKPPLSFELLDQFAPGLSALPAAVNDRQQFLAVVFERTYQNQDTTAFFVEPNVKVNAVRTPVNVAFRR
jgi:hypothetical protein